MATHTCRRISRPYLVIDWGERVAQHKSGHRHAMAVCPHKKEAASSKSCSGDNTKR